MYGEEYINGNFLFAAFGVKYEVSLRMVIRGVEIELAKDLFELSDGKRNSTLDPFIIVSVMEGRQPNSFYLYWYYPYDIQHPFYLTTYREIDSDRVNMSVR